MNRRLSVLGSTGSIGRQTLEVAEQLGFSVAALAARADIVLANDGTQEQLRRQAGALAARLLAEGERGTDCPV